MKKLLLTLFALALFVVPVVAEENPGAYFHIGQIDFTYPLAHVDATPYWKSITTGDEMFGAQTALAGFPRQPVVFRGVTFPVDLVKLNFGGITSLKANGMPYLSLTLKLCKVVNMEGQEITYIGLGYGHDFRDNKDHLLLGASIKIY